MLTPELKNLINECAVADAEVKRLTADIIKPGKELLTDYHVATPAEKKLDTGLATCAFTDVPAYDPIPPAILLAHFGGDIEKFMHCVAVSATALKTVCGTEEIEKLRGPQIGTTVRVALKLKGGK